MDKSENEPCMSRYEACPHCRMPNHLEIADWFTVPVHLNPGGGHHSGICFVAKCSSCGGSSLYRTAFGEYPDDFPNAKLVWPRNAELPESVPPAVRTRYTEAWRVQHQSPSSYAVQIRRALEAICNDRGLTKGSLQQRLRALESDGHFPSLIADISNALRVLGNLGAHDSDRELTIYDTARIDECFRAILDYLYIMPARLAAIRSLTDATGNENA